jgi:predicted  nucleic acid-binding Zn-ribbon protein
MRSNKLVSMDIDQLRGWAAFMDKAMIASLIATILAVAALGVSTWLSFRYSAAVRAHEQAAFDRYKGMEGQSARLEQEVAMAREQAAALEREVTTARARAATLEQEVSTGRGRTAALEQEVSAARERAEALEREASRARERAAAFEQAAREANEQTARAARESAAASERARTQQLDAAEMQQRIADLGKRVREAAARTADPSQGSAAETPRPAQGEVRSESAAAASEPQPAPIVASLRKYAGTKAAVFILDQVSDAPPAGSTIAAHLGDAGWAAQTWTWKDVAGIYGVVVLIKEGSDPATNEAASALVEALRSTGFNATKGDWPADWRRFRGVLDGPQTPGPTEAPIRVVVGAKPR